MQNLVQHFMYVLHLVQQLPHASTMQFVECSTVYYCSVWVTCFIVDHRPWKEWEILLACPSSQWNHRYQYEVAVIVDKSKNVFFLPDRSSVHNLNRHLVMIGLYGLSRRILSGWRMICKISRGRGQPLLTLAQIPFIQWTPACWFQGTVVLLSAGWTRFVSMKRYLWFGGVREKNGNWGAGHRLGNGFAACTKSLWQLMILVVDQRYYYRMLVSAYLLHYLCLPIFCPLPNSFRELYEIGKPVPIPQCS